MDPLGSSGASGASSGGALGASDVLWGVPWAPLGGPGATRLDPGGSGHTLAPKSSKTIVFIVVLGEKGGGTISPAPANHTFWDHPGSY